jgi:hypothetical protein
MKRLPLAVLISLLSYTAFWNPSFAAITSKGEVIDLDETAYTYLKNLVSPIEGIGAREAGTDEEKRTAEFIETHLRQWNYRVTVQNFAFKERGQSGISRNIIADIGNPEHPTIILAAHYDSTAMNLGSMGAIDNGAGVAAMLAIAQVLTEKVPQNYNIRFIAFGAEEVGLSGSKHYVQNLLTHEKPNNIAAMINFDTIVGGDHVYVHSAHSKTYKECTTENYSSDTSIRNAVLSASNKVLGKSNKYTIHPDYADYPAGETGPWSDHASFACAGIPIAYVESTNFSINGRNGKDGYSQSTNNQLWQCFNESTNTACDRDAEKSWGEIWHTKFDTLDNMNKLFPQRIKKQLSDNVKVLVEFLSFPDKYIKL